MRFAIVTLHHLDRPIFEIDGGALRGLYKVVMVLQTVSADYSDKQKASRTYSSRGDGRSSGSFSRHF